jgi:hypothetical protein
MFKWWHSPIIYPLFRSREAVLSRTLDDEIHIRVLANEAQEVDMLWTIFVVLLILWLLGFSLHIGGGLIHLLLVVGLVVLVINLLSGRRSAV